MKILVTREITQGSLEALKKQFGAEEIEVHRGAPMTPEQLKEAVKGREAILSLLTDKITSEILDSAGPQLKIVANYAVGFDNVDIDACTKRGIVVTNTPGTQTEAVAEHAIALLMAVTRQIPQADRFVREGRYKYWEPMIFLGPKLMGKTLGIVGLGRIGRQLAKMCIGGFGMKVIYYDIGRDDSFEKECKAIYARLDDLLERSDFVSVHVPLLPSTHHLIGEREFKKMKPTAILINTSRGPVVDENALSRALQEGWIEGAGIDVYEFEPKPVEGLTDCKSVVLTPHIASATREARIEMGRLCVQAITDVLVNKKIPENIVNKDVKPKF